MKKAYLLLFNGLVGRENVKEWADKSDLVFYWKTEFPNSFFLISEATAEELARDLRSTRPYGRFLITEITNNRQGWLDPETWHLFRNKMPKLK